MPGELSVMMSSAHRMQKLFADKLENYHLVSTYVTLSFFSVLPVPTTAECFTDRHVTIPCSEAYSQTCIE